MFVQQTLSPFGGAAAVTGYAPSHWLGLGMVMLSPPVISLPCKLLLFVTVDGWALVCNGVVQSFR